MHDNRALLGRRSQNVGVYPDLWEFAPGGVVESGKSPAEVVVSEWSEETGLTTQSEPTPIAVVSDPTARTWALIYLLNDPQGEAQSTPEYSEVRWCSRNELPDDLSPIARSMTPLWPTSQG